MCECVRPCQGESVSLMQTSGALQTVMLLLCPRMLATHSARTRYTIHFTQSQILGIRVRTWHPHVQLLLSSNCTDCAVAYVYAHSRLPWPPSPRLASPCPAASQVPIAHTACCPRKRPARHSPCTQPGCILLTLFSSFSSVAWRAIRPITRPGARLEVLRVQQVFSISQSLLQPRSLLEPT